MSTFPVEAHHVKKGGMVMLKDRPCKVVEVKTSKTGKHGHAKCNITGLDVITGKKYNEVHPGHITLVSFEQKRTEYEVSHVSGDKGQTQVHVLDAEGATLEFQEFYGEDKGSKLEHEVRQLVEESETNSKFYIIGVLTAPCGAGEAIANKSVITEIKEGKD